jgi:hypothetical protein
VSILFLIQSHKEKLYKTSICPEPTFRGKQKRGQKMEKIIAAILKNHSEIMNASSHDTSVAKIYTHFNAALDALVDNNMNACIQHIIKMQYLVNSYCQLPLEYLFDDTEIDRINMLILANVIKKITDQKIHHLKEQDPTQLAKLYKAVNSLPFVAIISQLGKVFDSKLEKNNNFLGGDIYGFLKIIIQKGFHEIIVDNYTQLFKTQMEIYELHSSNPDTNCDTSVLSAMIAVNGNEVFSNARVETDPQGKKTYAINELSLGDDLAKKMNEETEKRADQQIKRGVVYLKLLSLYAQFKTYINKLIQWCTSFSGDKKIPSKTTEMTCFNASAQKINKKVQALFTTKIQSFMLLLTQCFQCCLSANDKKPVNQSIYTEKDTTSFYASHNSSLNSLPRRHSFSDACLARIDGIRDCSSPFEIC